jgi:hypothetical protein
VGGQRITKRVVDSLKPEAAEFAVWDAQLTGFGVRVRPSGAMSYVVSYRLGSGRAAPEEAPHHRCGRKGHAGASQNASAGHPGLRGPRSRPGAGTA